ncbi:MAG: C25 family cysteine peptidase, partial [Planctomycetota bacterium]
METRKILAMVLAVFFLLTMLGMEGEVRAQGSRLKARPTVSSAKNDEIVMEYEFSAPDVGKKGEYDLLTMPGLKLYVQVGAPIVPMRTVKVSIPFGRKVAAVRTVVVESEELAGEYYLACGQKAYPRSYTGVKKPTEPDPAIYGKAEPWPGKGRVEIGTQSKRGYQVYIANLLPVQYTPTTGKVSYAKKMRLEIDLDASEKGQILRSTKHIRAMMKHDVDNAVTVEAYPLSEATYRPERGTVESDIIEDASITGGGIEMGMMEMGEGGSPLSDPCCPYYGENYKYVVITTEDLMEDPCDPCAPSSSYSFEALCDSKSMAAGVVTTEWIYANYDGTKPSGGSDNQTRIRNFLIDAYNTWGTEYVLLGGNKDIIPVRTFYVSYGASTAAYIPCDMYYGCVEPNECTFDYNADGKYGGPVDGVDGGEVDLYAEIYVGRAAVANVDEVENFVNKTLSYTPPTDSDGGYEYYIMQLGEYLDPGYGKPDMEEIRGIIDYSYCSDVFDTTYNLYDEDWYWSRSHLRDAMNGTLTLYTPGETPIAFNHLGHGNETAMCGYKSFNTSYIKSELDNTDYFFVYSQACLAGRFNYSNCFAEVITTMEHGAYAAIMNS